MFSSKSNVYSIEWLDVVFANRNQSYGAYELRKNYNSRLSKALVITISFTVAAICLPKVYDYLKKDETVESNYPPVIEDPVLKITDINMAPKKMEAEKPAGNSKPAPKVNMKKFVNMTVVQESQANVEPPSQLDLTNVAVGPTDQAGEGAASNVMVATNPGEGGNGTGLGDGNGTSEEVINVNSIENQPAFPGGMEAFIKYLRKNLRYPSSAVENDVAGRVYVNFIVEKDGKLTDIKVVKGIGFGCDEEAIRVLKRSPDWSPGEQNGRKVRVMYTLPIVFSMGE